MKSFFKKKLKNNDKYQVVGPSQIAFERFKKNKVSVAGLIIFTIIVLSVIIIPEISRYDLNEFQLDQKHLPPSSQYLLGTDMQGRDMVFRLFYGGRISIKIGLLVALVSISIGTLIGGVSGYYGGKVDNFLMRLTEIFYTIPFLPTLICIAAIFMWYPPNQKIYIVMFIIAILSWTGLARFVRGQILSLREQEFMQATEILGLSTRSRIVRHLLPNVLTYIVISAAFSMAGAILSETALSFLGLGVQSPYPSWGNLIQAARNGSVMKNYPWMWVPPGVMILLTVVSINLIGEGLRDAFDPKEVR